MNLSQPLVATRKHIFRFWLSLRGLLPEQKCRTFGIPDASGCRKIEKIYVINLDRQPGRWTEMERELRHILDSSGTGLWNLTERYSAVDAKSFTQDPHKDSDIDPFYTLGDQLFIEPQPLVLPARLELNAPIQMSRPEIAIARSHIDLWRQVAANKHEYALILEDDVWFQSGFAPHLDQAWDEIEAECDKRSKFDILYVSYVEVKHGAPKTFISDNVFRPTRGLWHLSGYVLSRKGAEKLLLQLPCRGPVDLWINQQFRVLDVLATRRSIIKQRRDAQSTNLYSILPSLTRIGAINSERASLFHVRPTERPVFAFGPEGSGLSSLAMALSMLGYRSCSDLQSLPGSEYERLLEGKCGRVFDAYVNIKSLATNIRKLQECFPRAKFFITTGKTRILDNNDLNITDDLNGADVAILHLDAPNKWQVICEHLRCAPPDCSYPCLEDIGQRQLFDGTSEANLIPSHKTPKHDKSPWIVENREWWQGIRSVPKQRVLSNAVTPVRFSDSLECIDMKRWLLRDDTFTDNLALFRPANVAFRPGIGVTLNVRKEFLGVREYSAASLSSRDRYLFGRFKTIIKASNVPGVITGFFLHRDSPRQEIDIEIAGKRPDRLLANVFYNPGSEGTQFDYGYRGAASYIDLGFDASADYHHYAIEWDPYEIRWFVDNRIVHMRVEWNPTPIPHLPMALHANTWPSRSKELAGHLANRRLPTTTFMKSIALEANLHHN